MIKDKAKIIEALNKMILGGNDPYYDSESARDHGFDWLELTKEEFEDLSAKARLKRTLNSSKDIKVSKVLKEYFFPFFINDLLARHPEKGVSIDAICTALKNSISTEILINNLAELFRLSKKEIESDLEELGFKDLIEQYKLKNIVSNNQGDSQILICDKETSINPFPELFAIHSRPGLTEAIRMDSTLKRTFNDLFSVVSKNFAGDPFAKLYRDDVLGYYTNFRDNIAPLIREEIDRKFNGSYPKYMVTTGIGANEQFSHYVASLNNQDKNRRLEWLVINSPKNLSKLPADATVENTLFVEFSRSSLTEETIKIHEYTPRNAHRIVFSNHGPLKEIALRDNNLILELPGQVSGRFGRNKTPILMAPMFIAGMNIEEYWKDIALAIKAFDISDTNSLPFAIAKFILISHKLMPKNFIYLGCNDDMLALLADEFIQFWNEGVNKDGSDLLVSRFFGLPRDSHMNLEGILGNQRTKMGLFLLRTNMHNDKIHPMVSYDIDPINPEHKGLHYGDEEAILAVANYKRISEVMPSLLIEIKNEPNLRHSAILGQLFSDVTFIFSRLVGIDPGSNPEVKFVRERSESLLAEVAKKMRESNASIDEILFHS